MKKRSGVDKHDVAVIAELLNQQLESQVVLLRTSYIVESVVCDLEGLLTLALVLQLCQDATHNFGM